MPSTVSAYLKNLPAERQGVIEHIRNILLQYLPRGFKGTMGYR